MSVNRKVTVPWVGRSSARRPPFATAYYKAQALREATLRALYPLGGSPVP